MNKNNNNHDKEYSLTDFSSIISSPVFLAVLVLAFILGLSTVFGFFQDPRKLKAIIDIVSQRIFISEVARSIKTPRVASYKRSAISSGQLQTIYKWGGYIVASSLDGERYSILSEQFTFVEMVPVSRSMKVGSIDYDIASKKFWGKLNIRLGLMDKQSTNLSYVIQSDKTVAMTPISPYYSLDKDSLKYSLGVTASES